MAGEGGLRMETKRRERKSEKTRERKEKRKEKNKNKKIQGKARTEPVVSRPDTNVTKTHTTRNRNAIPVGVAVARDFRVAAGPFTGASGRNSRKKGWPDLRRFG